MNEGSSKSPHISVIIPVRNGGELLEKCLEAIWRQDAAPYTFEVLVVDNGSLEDTRQRVEKFPETILLHEPRHSAYAARNLGLQHARGKYIAFTDADAVSRPGWLRHGVEGLLQSGGPWLVAGHVEITLEERPNIYQIYDKLHNLLQERYVKDGKYGVTANLFVDRQLLDRSGLFEEQWVSSADQEFCWRAIRHGGEITYRRDAAVDHPPRSSLAEIRTKQIRTGQGHTQLARKMSALGRKGGGLPLAILRLPLLLWPGIHAFRPRFHGGLHLRLHQMAALQLLHWLGKFHISYGSIVEALRPTAGHDA